LRAEADPYYGRGHQASQLTGYVPNAFSNKVMADRPDQASPRRLSIHDRLGPRPQEPGFTNPGFPSGADNGVAGVTFPVLDHTLSGYGTPPPNLNSQTVTGGFVATTTPPPAPAPAPFYPDYSATAFANGVLNLTGPGVDPNAQLIQTLNQFQAYMTQVEACQTSLETELEAKKRSTGPLASLPGLTRFVPQYASAPSLAPPAFAPYMAPQGMGQSFPSFTQPLSSGYMANPAPSAAYQPAGGPTSVPPFAPPSAYQPSVGPFPAPPAPVPPQPFYHPYAGGVGIAPNGGAFPRTGFSAPPGEHGAVPVRRSNTFHPPTHTSSAGFIPIQPAKPLLIDDFLPFYALHALKAAPGKLMVDPRGQSLFVPTDLSGVGTKKLKCPDLPAWLKASDKNKSALITMGAIQGPDYDRYFDSWMTLLLDPKCGGNGWSLEIFFDFDNAHRLQQWQTGSAFDVICPLRMAHFAAMSANSKLTPSTFLGNSGNSKKRGPRAATTSRAGKPARAPPQHCYQYNNTGHCSKMEGCQFASTHKCISCNGTHKHAPGTCPNNPQFVPGPSPDDPGH
jgi:hypothetical protein